MPWSPDDADRFKKGLSPASKRRWASVANGALKQYGNEGKAIKIANGITRTAVNRRLKKYRKGVSSG